MGFLEFLNHWWNFPFLVMLALVAVFFLLQLVGIVGHHGGEHEIAHEADADVGHEAEIAHEADAGDLAHGHADHEGAGHEAGGLLELFGIGHVPFMVIWVTLFLVAGFTGLAVNRVFFLERDAGYPAWAFVVALFAALIIGMAAVALAARLAGKLVDTGGHGSISKSELRGKLGTVASAHLDHTFGEVRVNDGRGNEMIVHARTEAGEAPLRHGDRVVLVDYDPDTDLFWATASPAEAQAGDAT